MKTKSLFHLLALLALVGVGRVAQAAEGAPLLAGRRVMVLGDSITQNGTYVSFLEYLLQKQYPELNFDLVSVGLGSETTSGLSENGHAGGAFPRPCVHERLGRALAEVKPAVVLACYGMNDGIYQPYSEERMKAFRDGVTRLAQDCRAAGAEVALVTPPIHDDHKSYPGFYDQVLARFAEWEVKSPPPGVVAVADLHTAMSEALVARKKDDPKFTFSGDGVHPDELGHLVMALSILDGLQIKRPAGTPEQLLGTIKADPLFELVSQHRATRSQGWLAYIGYTREKKVAPHTGDIAAVEARAAELQKKVDALRRP